MNEKTFGKLLGNLILEKREGAFTQLELGEEAFPDGKKDIIRTIGALERGESANPRRATYWPVCEVLNITKDEIRRLKAEASNAKAQQDTEFDELLSREGSADAALQAAASLGRDDLELLAARFEIPAPFDLTETALRQMLTNKAEEYHAYRKQIDSLDARVAAIANLKGAAQDAADKLNFDEVEDLLSRVTEVEAEIFAESTLARAQNALLRHKVDQAFTLLNAAADACAVIDPLEPARRRGGYQDLLYQHGLRYGGNGLLHAITMSESIIANADGKDQTLWARAQNNLALALQDQATRTKGAEGAALLSRAIAAYGAALTVFTRDAHPVNWAATQQNLAGALQTQAIRTEGAQGVALLSRAIAAYGAALTVFTRDAHPVDWAMTQENLAILHLNKAAHDTSTDPQTDLTRALAHVEAALEVYDPAHMSFDYQTATELRADILAKLSD